MRILSGLLISTLFYVFVLFISGCHQQQSAMNGQTMGSYYSIKYLALTESPSADVVQKQIDELLEQVNAKMSTYRADSELSQFNQSRQTHQPFPVSDATLTVIEEAIRLHKLTNGALDITIGPLVNLWGFGPETLQDKLPTAEELEQRKHWVGMDKLAIQGNALVKMIPELYLDLSSIAKGYAVDIIADYFDSVGIHNYLVDIGGEVRTRGLNERKLPWRIAIEKPAVGINRTVQAVIAPGDRAIATSGDYRNFFDVDGVRYSHSINPRTGKPIVNNVVSVTVLASSCMTADGLATALTILGLEDGMALANKLAISAMMMTKTEKGFEVHYSSVFPQDILIH